MVVPSSSFRFFVFAVKIGARPSSQSSLVLSVAGYHVSQVFYKLPRPVRSERDRPHGGVHAS
jgi:hypothetical protein